MHSKTASPPSQLTPRQLQLLTVIASFQASRCYSPTIAELAREFRISRSTVFEHIAELRKKDLLRASEGKARSLKLTSTAQELLSRVEHTAPVDQADRPASIPLAGIVAAGSALEAIENTDYLSLHSYFGIDDDTFALEVRGDSMIDADIRDGDYVVCQRRRTADQGQIVVAIIDNGNATLKRFYKEDARIRLEPANDEYEPIYATNCRIEAVVVGLVRKL